jgi:hypothetical protein
LKFPTVCCKQHILWALQSFHNISHQECDTGARKERGREL